MLSSRPATILSSILLIAALGLFTWIAVGGATSDQPAGPTRGATPEAPTPTISPATYSSREATRQAVHDLGVGEVLDQALARDVDGLMKSISWERIACDDPLLIRNACAISGVSAGSSIQAFHLEDSTRYFDRNYVAEFLDSLVGSSEAELVFAARTSEYVGLSIAVPQPTKRPIGGGSPLRGIWFDVRLAGNPAIDHIYFFTEFTGPRQFYQTFYQPKGGEILYFDETKAPGLAPLATPEAPKP